MMMMETHQVDVDGSGAVEWDEFCVLMYRKVVLVLMIMIIPSIIITLSIMIIPSNIIVLSIITILSADDF